MSDILQSTYLNADTLSSYLSSVPGVKLWQARKHLLDTKDLTKTEVECLLSFAFACKKLYLKNAAPLSALNTKTIANVFYENSTRTRCSFELAAKKLGAAVINLDTQLSSIGKGETTLDTAKALMAMGVDAIVQRHASAGSAHQLVNCLENIHRGSMPGIANVSNQAQTIHIINAGDGANAHPTQALLDLMTMIEAHSNLSGAKVAIIGDIAHSRVARSNIWLLKLFGADIHIAGPPTLMPAELTKLGVKVHNSIEPAIEDADFVMALRIQFERQKKGLIPSLSEYQKCYRLDHKRLSLAKHTVRILHPGPVNRDLEISNKLVDDPQYSLIETQITNGVAVRMATLYLLLASQEECH